MVPIIIAAVYFIGFSIFFGIRARKKVKSGKDFFIASNQLVWPAVMCSFVLAPLGGGHTSALFEQQAAMGVSVLWWGILAGGVFVPVFMLWFGPWIRRMKVDTFPQALGKIFGPKIKFFNASVAPAAWLGISMSELLGTATAIYCLGGGKLAYAPHCVLLAALILILYILLAGMLQASYMNLINAVMLILGGFIAVVYIGNWLPNGYSGVEAVYTAAGEAWRTNLFNFTPNIVLGVMIPVLVLHVCSVSSEHALYQPMLAAKSEEDCRRGAIPGGMINSLAAFPWVILGVTATSIPAIAALEPRLSVPELALAAMPPALIGLLMVALLAALVSTGSGMILAVAHVVTDDIIKPLAGNKLDEKKNMILGKVMVVIVTLAAAIPALQVSLIMPLFFWCFSLSMPLFVSYFIGMTWKISRKAAWTNIIVSTLVNFWWTFATPSWCPPAFSMSFYPVAACSIVLGIVLNLVLPGEKGMLHQLKEAEQLAA